MSSEADKKIITWQDFKNTSVQRDVYRFLDAMGYDVSERTVQRHCKDGKLRKGKGNKFTRRLVSEYAKNNLHLKEAPETENEANAGAQAKRAQEQAAREELNRKMDEIRLKKMEGSVVDKEALHLELASRAVALDSGFKQMVSANSMEWIVLVNGDTDKLSEFIDTLHQAWDSMIGTYATQDEFEVLFEEEE